MRTLLLVGFLAIACGGSGGQSVNPAGSWTLTDTLQSGSCAASATETLSVSGDLRMQGYAMTASYCETHYCELQGFKDGATRDIGFYGDTASGTRSSGGCVYFTAGTRTAH